MEGKTLLIGQAPSRRSDPAVPLGGRSGRRLAALLGISFEDYLERFSRVNLLGMYPGADVKGDLFPVPEARHSARELLEAMRDRRVVFMGRRVANAFRLDQHLSYFEWVALELGGEDLGSCEAALFPHPSGVNLWWNEPGNENRARSFLKEL